VLDIAAELVDQPGLANVVGLVMRLLVLPVVGRGEQARAIAEETLLAARSHANPNLFAVAFFGYGRAFAETDPAGALEAMRQALVLCHEHHMLALEGNLSREAAALEAVHGDPDQALELFESAIASLQRASDVANSAVAFADLAVLFDRLEQPNVAATLYGASAHHGDIGWVLNLPTVVAHLREALGQTAYDDCVATGTAMDFGDAVRYAHDQIQHARGQLSDLT